MKGEEGGWAVAAKCIGNKGCRVRLPTIAPTGGSAAGRIGRVPGVPCPGRSEVDRELNMRMPSVRLPSRISHRAVTTLTAAHPLSSPDCSFRVQLVASCSVLLCDEGRLHWLLHIVALQPGADGALTTTTTFPGLFLDGISNTFVSPVGPLLRRGVGSRLKIKPSLKIHSPRITQFKKN